MNDWKLFRQDRRDSLNKVLVFWVLLGFWLCLDCLEILVLRDVCLRDDMFLGFALQFKTKSRHFE